MGATAKYTSVTSAGVGWRDPFSWTGTTVRFTFVTPATVAGELDGPLELTNRIEAMKRRKRLDRGLRGKPSSLRSSKTSSHTTR